MMYSRTLFTRAARSQIRRRENFSIVAGRYGIGNQPQISVNTDPFVLRRDDESDTRRKYHTTAPSEKAVAIILGLTSVSALAFAGSSAVKSYNAWKASLPSDEEMEAERKKEEKERLKQEEMEKKKQQEKKGSDKPRENVFKEWFGVGVGSKYYEGGFEDTMTKREAALILGVRESSSPQRIKAAHRKLLVLNHPDTGGSTYMAGKINEAKELMLKGKARV
ncbi:unnamed protein product [Cylindrotheca closterium]|uniref:J domain-containing protein n=1 Tax=Cylindrotheca closterium TaxID=2856 RepID=A0AAD2FTM8_9STRA|nr:unnamed protein product [Cylindrotheca closterium]